LLITRILTAVALLAAFIAALALLERTQFAMLVALIVALGAFEWGKLSHLRHEAAAVYAGAITLFYGTALWLVYPIGARHGALTVLFGAAALLWIAILPAWLRVGLAKRPRWLFLVAGFAVLLPAALAMVVLWRTQLLLALGLVWISDTAAFFAGRAFGHHKLAPEISPGKTWEGVAGAALATAGYAIICAVLVPRLGERVQGAVWAAYLAGAELLLLASVLGDLFESALKRQASVKDSGSLLPGHGGVLDRIDSATAVLPIAALLLNWMTKT
jgi:phosphatidate cytidylyltransferase